MRPPEEVTLDILTVLDVEGIPLKSPVARRTHRSITALTLHRRDLALAVALAQHLLDAAFDTAIHGACFLQRVQQRFFDGIRLLLSSWTWNDLKE